MKPIHFLPPLLALVAVTAWLAKGRSTITSLEEQTVILRQRLAARSAGVLEETASARPDAPGRSTNEKKPIDWKEFAAQMQDAKSNDGLGDVRSIIRLQQRLQSMTRDEIVNALDEIAALDLPDDSKLMLEQALFGPLCKKDPEFALNRYVDTLNDQSGMFRWQLTNAMKEWAAKDTPAATAWFDQQIEAGKFDSKSLDGKNPMRLQFEGSLIGALLSTDPDAISKRLHALPEDQRKEVLKHHVGNAVKDEDQLAFATLVRQELTESEQSVVLANQCSRMAMGGSYTEIDDYLDRIEATPTERAESVTQTVSSKVGWLSQSRRITRRDIDQLREWADTQSPETTDKATGRAIALTLNTSNKLKFAEAASLASEYHATSGNDEVLVEFFKNNWRTRQNRDEAIQLAEKISDPERRAEIIKSLD